MKENNKFSAIRKTNFWSKNIRKYEILAFEKHGASTLLFLLFKNINSKSVSPTHHIPMQLLLKLILISWQLTKWMKDTLV